MLDENTFDLGKIEIKKKATALMMTAADLCAITKPWHTQENTVDLLYEEFYEQGDLEKSEGHDPIPMMDRSKVEERPIQQVNKLPALVT